MRVSTFVLSVLSATGAVARDSKYFRRQFDNGTGYAVQEPPLTTDWTYKVGTDPWPEYPRPQLKRNDWKSLNGIWKYQNATGFPDGNAPPPGNYTQHDVLVPACLESGLSGVQAEYAIYSWYFTSFTVPSDWQAGNSSRVLLNFGAVDYEATVIVNGQQAGFHRGGYFTFTVDVTDFLIPGGENQLTVFVYDPTDMDEVIIPLGKQTLRPSHIFYRPCSGIWQSVWIEKAPSNYVSQLDIAADMHGEVNVTVHTVTGQATPVEISVYEKDSDDAVVTYEGTSDQAFQFTVDSPDLWSPDTPTLYDIKVNVGGDEITSYTGFRTFAVGEVAGVVRPLLNGKPIFLFGTLDQGYWPDGLHTPPNREAMEYDIKVLKNLGMNMVRKHIKVEPALFYRACDELGLVVIQDMPSLGQRGEKTLSNCTRSSFYPNAEEQAEFERQLEVMVNQQKNYPSIGVWVIYNEGWGQIVDTYNPEFGLTDRVRALDPTRLIDAASGWNDHGAGDIHDNHHYANPQCGAPFYSQPSTPYDPKRIGFQGEFGGIGHNVSAEHLWKVQQAIDKIADTYEMDQTLEAYNYRAHILLGELREQTERFACSGGVWTQTTDVEGEVNGLMTYDRRVLRVDVEQWQADIQALYDAIEKRSNNATMKMF